MYSASGNIEHRMLTAEIVAKTETDAHAAVDATSPSLNAALDAAANGFAVVATNAPYAVLYSNTVFATLLGYSQSECLQRNFPELCGFDSADPLLERLRDALSEHRDFDCESLARRPSGTTFWATLRVRVLRQKNGAPEHFVVTL